MSYWTEDCYGIQGPESEISRLVTDLVTAIHNEELVKKYNQINTFCITCGYFSKEYAEDMKMKLPAERQFSSSFFNFYGEITDIKREVADRLTFTVSAKWCPPGLKKVLNKVYPTLSVYYESFDECEYYSELEDYRLATNDTEGVFFKKYTLTVRDRHGDKVIILKSQDSGEFLQMIERLTGKTPASFTQEALDATVEEYLKAQGKGWTFSLFLCDYYYDQDEQRPLMLLTIARKLSAYLKANGCTHGVTFDHSSYDNPEDIPHLLLDRGRTDILGASLSDDGAVLTVKIPEEGAIKDHRVILDFDSFGECPPARDAAEYEGKLQEMNVYEVLQDIYYETSSSWKTGDFETDFLKI